MTYAIVIAGLVGIVFIHELGHFGVALLVGMRPRSFYVGFPPALVKIKRRGIEYGLGMIPLGGYVRIPGMHRPAARDLQALLASAIEEQPSLAPAALRVRRALTAEDYDAARAAYPDLEEDVAAAHLSPGVRRTAMRALRDVEEGTAPDAYWRAPTWKRIAVIAAGPAANVLAAFLILLVVNNVSGVTGANSPAAVAKVKRHTPAAAAGLKAGDLIVGVNGQHATIGNISQLIRSGHRQPLALVVARRGDLRTLESPPPVPQNGEWILGVVLTPIPIPYAFGSSTTAAAANLWSITSGTAAGLASLVRTHKTESLATGIGIARYSAGALRKSVPWYFQILASVSLSLALLNLVPLLPLDGGHILFSLIESVRRRSLAREVYERVSVVGLALMLLLFVIALQNDTRNLFG